jgi:hypothetical protein
MATRALIGYLDTNTKKLTTTYNHSDGYPEHLGRVLNDFFNSNSLAKGISNEGYISFINQENGEIEAKHIQAPDITQLPNNFHNAMIKIAEEIDFYGGSYGYIWDNLKDEWITTKNNGIEAMSEDLKMQLTHLKEIFKIPTSSDGADIFRDMNGATSWRDEKEDFMKLKIKENLDLAKEGMSKEEEVSARELARLAKLPMDQQLKIKKMIAMLKAEKIAKKIKENMVADKDIEKEIKKLKDENPKGFEKEIKKLKVRQAALKLSKKIKENSIVSKSRAKSSLKQIEKGKRDDGMGKFDAKVFAKKDGKEIELKTLSDLELLDKYSTDYEYILKEAQIPSNIAEFAKRKGISSLVRKVAGWAERVGARIAGGTAIGYNYNTLVLDLNYNQQGEIRINTEDETITLYGEYVYSFPKFKEVYEEENNKIELDETKEIYDIMRNNTLKEHFKRFINTSLEIPIRESKGEIDINDPMLIKFRAAKYDREKLASQPQSPSPKQTKTINPDYKAVKNASKINFLQNEKDQLLRDMEQEAEPEGGPIANKYGTLLNRIDKAIAKLKGQNENNPYKASMMNESEDNWNAIDVSRKAEKEISNNEWNSRTTKKLDILKALNKVGKFKKEWDDETLQGWVDQNYSWEKLSRQFKNL